MTVCVYAEFLAQVPTSANPARGVVRELVRLRPNDTFIFYVRRGSAQAPLLQALLRDCIGENCLVMADWKPRWFCNLLGLARYPRYYSVKCTADVYLHFDVDFLGPRATPAIYTIHDLAVVREPKRSTVRWHGVLLRRFALECLAKSDAKLVAISDFTRRDLIAYDAGFSDRTSVVRWGIDDYWFDHELAEQLPESKRPFAAYWIWYGYITKRKNLDGLLRAYAMLISAAPRPQHVPNLVIVGPLGHDSKDLPDLASRLKLTDRVRFLPFQKDPKQLASLVACSRGLVFPSYYEGFGLPCVEAMATGVPALVSDRTSQPEVAGGLAVLCDPSDDRSIAGGLRQLLDPRLFAPEAIAARKNWTSQFTHKSAATGYSALIARCARS